jgi:DNA polymerase elongation subunit (family B)
LVLDVPTDDVARYHELLTKARRYVLEKPYLPIDEVKRSQALKQAVHEYAPRVSTKGKESESLHVTVAKVLRERGEDVRQGTRIEYVVVDGASSPMRAIPASDYTGEVDRYYLWEKLVFPPTKRLLEAAFPGYEWSDWDKVRPQKPRGASNVLEGQVSMPGVDMSPKRASVLISGPTPVSQRSLRKRTA